MLNSQKHANVIKVWPQIKHIQEDLKKIFAVPTKIENSWRKRVFPSVGCVAIQALLKDKLGGGKGDNNCPRQSLRFDGPALCNVFSPKPQRAMPNEHEVSLVQGIIPQWAGF